MEVVLQGVETTEERAVAQCKRITGSDTVGVISSQTTNSHLQLQCVLRFALSKITPESEGDYGFICTSNGSDAGGGGSNKRSHEDVSPVVAYLVIRCCQNSL